MTGSIVGTPHYMSPEQVQGQPVDGRCDQFSLAVIAYEMLTGEKPYTGEHLTTVVYKIVAEEPVAPHRLNPSLSRPIENVLRKALAKKPDARYRNCQEFVEALEKACSASKGWKPMPRGGLLNAMTMADVKTPTATAAAPAAVLPPPRRKSRSAATSGTTAEVKRKSGFPGFLLGILVAAGFLALLGWQAAPWLMPGSQPSDTPGHSAGAPTEQAPPPATPAVTPPANPPATAPQDAKPSPMGQALPPAGSGPETAKSDTAKTDQSVPLRPELEAVKPAEPRGRRPRPSAVRSCHPRVRALRRTSYSPAVRGEPRRHSMETRRWRVPHPARCMFHRAGTPWRLFCPATKLSGASLRWATVRWN